MPGLRCHMWAFSGCSEWGLLSRCGDLAQYCGTWAELSHSVWDPSGQVIKSTSPGLAGRFLTMDHQGSPKLDIF